MTKGEKEPRLTRLAPREGRTLRSVATTALAVLLSGWVLYTAPTLASEMKWRASSHAGIRGSDLVAEKNDFSWDAVRVLPLPSDSRKTGQLTALLGHAYEASRLYALFQ